MTRAPRLAVFALVLGALLATGSARAAEPDLVAIRGAKNFLTGYPALREDGTVNMVVEIPAGTTAKWEVSRSGDEMEWELKDGKRRVVHYLGYPGNYGMIPGSLQDPETGGDGDALDVLLLGNALPRGSVVAVRPIGVLRLVDTGERDDKILAVPLEGPLAGIRSLEDLDAELPGARTIVETWFTNYKGPGRMVSHGCAEADVAEATVRDAAAAYEAAHTTQEKKSTARSRRGQ